jgi:hypothetical protein
MSDPEPDRHIDPSLNEPGTRDQPGEFIDTPENQPGDQGDEPLSEVADPQGLDPEEG